MKKYIMFFAMIITVLGFNLRAYAITLTECEYSDDFKNWLKLDEKVKINTPMPAMCKHTYENININLKSTTSTFSDPNFSLVQDGYVTSVKDQQETNSCWAYSTVASIESNLLKKASSNTTLSPGHMELATQNNLFTPNRTTFNRDFNAGGNFFLSSAYVLNYWGPINERTAYSVDTLMNIIKQSATITAANVENVAAEYNVNDIAYVFSNSCDNNTKTTIKKYLVEHGAMAASIYMGEIANDANVIDKVFKDKFTNGPYYYYDGSAFTNIDGNSITENQNINHAVTIVGWDDTISKTNFSTQPTNDGAWLVKNSWGTSLYNDGTEVYKNGNDGYYYVSYEDNTICSSLAGFYNVNTDMSDNTYYYDDLGWVGELRANADTAYIANVFTKKTGENEKIDKITFGTSQVGLEYTIYYAPNGSLTDYTNNILKTGIIDHVGYTTVIIDDQKISTNKFGIVIKLHNNESSGTVLLPIATQIPDTTMANAPIIEEVSFISENGNNWADTTTENVMNSIKVYTSADESDVNIPDDDNDNNDDSDDDNVIPSDDIIIDKNDDSVIPDVTDVIKNPQTGIENINITMVSMLFISTLGYIFLKRIVIFNKF